VKKSIVFFYIFIAIASSLLGQTPSHWFVCDSLLIDFTKSPNSVVSLGNEKLDRNAADIILTSKIGEVLHYGILKRESFIFKNLQGKESEVIVDSALKSLFIDNNFIGFRANKFIPANNLLYGVLGVLKEDNTTFNALIKFEYNETKINIAIVDTLDNNNYQFVNAGADSFYVVSTGESRLFIRKYSKTGKLESKRALLVGFSRENSQTFNNAVLAAANKDNSFIISAYDSLGSDSIRLVLRHYVIQSTSKLKLVDSRNIGKPRLEWNTPSIFGACFTSNDSFLYYIYSPYLQSFGYATKLYRMKLYGDKSTVLIENKDSLIFYRCALAPDAKVYFGGYSQKLRPNAFLGRINFPEKSEEQDFGLNFKYLGRHSPNNGSIHRDNYTAFETNSYLGQSLLKQKCLQKNCTDSFIQCYNYSDTVYKSFGWVLMDLDSNIISKNSTKTTKFYPPETGSYLVRLSGKTRFGRNAYRWDKVFFRKPARIKHNVIADTLCRFSKLPLSATFKSDTTNESSIIWRIKSPLKEDEFNKRRINHMFADTGFYTLKLVYNSGYCTDSLSFNKVFYVVNAPEPGFKINRDTICTSTEISVIDKSNGVATNVTYHWSDGKVFTNREGHNRVFEKSGFYKLVQSLEASNKCLSKDSINIRVKKGLTTDSLPQLKYATVIDSSMIELQWETIDGIEGYIVKRMNDDIDRKFSSHEYSLLDTFNATISPVAYRLFAIDSCMNLSGQSNFAQTILLTTKNQNNEQIELSWNEYEEWQNGVSEYLVQRSNDGINWNNIAGLESKTFQDNTILLSNADSVFYRVIAKKSGDALTSSVSNVRNVNLLSTAFIPNAFSPNADGLNDTFCIGYFGLKSFKCIIFSNTGQVVSVSENPNNIWDGYSSIGEPYPTDTYFYFITYTTSKGETIELKGNLDLIKN
jgi:gliding motility-associated-like protein